MQLLILVLKLLLVTVQNTDAQKCMPLAIPIAIALAASAYKIGKGASQNSKGNKLLQTPRPMRTTSQFLLDNNRLARNEAGKYGLPGQGIIEDKMSGDVSNAVNALLMSQQDPASVAQGVATLNNNQLDAESNLGVKAAQYRSQQLGTYMNSNTVLAGEDQKNWEWNRKMPYLDAMAAASALKNAGQRNIDSGIADIAKIGISATSGGFGGGKTPNPLGGGNGAPPEKDTYGVPLADINTNKSAADFYVDDADKANQEKMYQKALMMNPNLTRDQFRQIWVRPY